MSWFFKTAELSSQYAKHRPTYPKELYESIWSFFSEGRLAGDTSCEGLTAVDVGCGAGQSTLALCPYFDHVIGVDQSDTQIEEARLALTSDDLKAKVTYRVGSADDLAFLQDASVDMITVATALHWFGDLIEKFFREAARVLRPGGVIAAYAYNFDSTLLDELPNKDEFLSSLRIYMEVAEKELQLKVLFDGYQQPYLQLQSIFPACKRIDGLQMKMKVSVDGFAGFIHSMSLYHKFAQDHPDETNPMDAVIDKVRETFADSTDPTPVVMTFPLFSILGKKELQLIQF